MHKRNLYDQNTISGESVVKMTMFAERYFYRTPEFLCGTPVHFRALAEAAGLTFFFYYSVAASIILLFLRGGLRGERVLFIC